MPNGYVVCEPITITVSSGSYKASLTIERFDQLISSGKPVLFSEISLAGLVTARSIFGSYLSDRSMEGLAVTIGDSKLSLFKINGELSVSVET